MFEHLRYIAFESAVRQIKINYLLIYIKAYLASILMYYIYINKYVKFFHEAVVVYFTIEIFLMQGI